MPVQRPFRICFCICEIPFNGPFRSFQITVPFRAQRRTRFLHVTRPRVIERAVRGRDRYLTDRARSEASRCKSRQPAMVTKARARAKASNIGYRWVL